MSTAELVIAQAIYHFDGNASSHVKREEVIDSAATQGYYGSTMRSTAAVIIVGYRNGKLQSVSFESVVYRLGYLSALLLFDRCRQPDW